MLATQSEIKARIDQLKLSYDGYTRQLARPTTEGNRRERLDLDIRLLGEEIATLEKLAQLSRAVEDRARIEQIVRERLEQVRQALAQDVALSGLSEEQRDYASGEVKALVWALGQDPIMLGMQEIMRGHERADPGRTDRALPAILLHQLTEAPDPETRASAAYELGKLHITQAIPSLAAARSDHPLVAEVAAQALAMFTPDDLAAAGVEK